MHVSTCFQGLKCKSNAIFGHLHKRRNQAPKFQRYQVTSPRGPFPQTLLIALVSYEAISGQCNLLCDAPLGSAQAVARFGKLQACFSENHGHGDRIMRSSKNFSRPRSDLFPKQRKFQGSAQSTHCTSTCKLSASDSICK